jgi:GT2 family glycosyltransferase/2-polyprenyl-3-methyl-5-hydroxy-6-metoxy-1,4-benzoquinol methylase
MYLANYNKNNLYSKINSKYELILKGSEIDINNKNSSPSIIVDLIAENSIVLDVGCSYGYLGKWLKINKNCEVYGIDNDYDALNYAKQEADYDDVFLIDLDKPEGEDFKRFNQMGTVFDYIVIGDALEHLKDPAYILILLSEKLKFYSNFIISVPNISNADIILNLIEGKFNYGDAGLLDRTHLRFFTKNSFIEFIESINQSESLGDFKFQIDFITSTIYVSDFVKNIISEKPILYNLLKSANPEIDVLQNIYALTKVKKDDNIFDSKARYNIKPIDKIFNVINELIRISQDYEKELNNSKLLLKEYEAKIELLQNIAKHNPQLKSNNETVKPISDFLNLLQIEPSMPIVSSQSAIDILIPVYNGNEFLDSLFRSIIENTSIPYRLLIANDKSTDPNIIKYLTDFKINNPNIDITIIENENNLGFVKTINRLTKLIKNNFVILNTDVEVPPHWIERLMYPILTRDDIASTTPFTNAGTICSFPNFLKDNQIFENLDVITLDYFFQYVDFEKNCIEIPTGVGFCMGINKKVFEKIGMFDEIFGKGYGEENDWSMRARRIGYKNIIVPNLFVYHKHGGSFSNEDKNKLKEHNSYLLRIKHPDYFPLVEEFIKFDGLNLMKLRKILEIKILSNLYKFKIIINHSIGGGANEYLKILVSNEKLIAVVAYDAKSGKYIITFSGRKIEEISFEMKDIKEFELIIKHINIKEIIINELVTYPKILDLLDFLIDFKKNNNCINFIFIVHDFFCVCPQYNLLNYEVKYCGVPHDFNYCNDCLKKLNSLLNNDVSLVLRDYPELTIALWREKFKYLLDHSEKIICFSRSSVDILKRAYLDMIECKLKITPHCVDWVNPVVIKKTSDTINIGVLGHLTIHKGSLIVDSLAGYIYSHNMNFRIHIFGNIFVQNKNFENGKTVVKHGEYEKIDLPKLMETNEIDIILVPSICPETFSYTTEEAIKMELPIAVFDIGAPAERVKSYGKGIILQNQNPEYILRKIYNYLVHNKFIPN